MRIQLLMLLIILAAASLLAQGEHAVNEELAVRAEMRDGVSLVADVYRPDVAGELPVLLQRTPYDRKTSASQARELASHGYIVVVQDTRGRYDSEGEFYPFLYERDDGFDTVEWAAALAGSNGKVGMYGGSYVGATQMLAAISEPPHLVAIFPYITSAEYYEGWTYQGGALMQWFAGTWTSGLAQDTLRREVSDSSRTRDWMLRMPVDSYPILDVPSMDETAPYFDDWIEHETDDAYWQRWKISDHYGALSIKALHGGGWHDIFLEGSIGNYIGMSQSAETAEARAAQRLWIGPWAHAATSPEGKVGDVVFGKAAASNMTETIRAWSDYSLKDVANEFATGGPVRIFVMGDNVWRQEQEFPLARAVETSYYLSSSNGANGLRGDGRLRLDAPASEKPDTFVYDPGNPVPTIGGRLCCGNDVIAPGPYDQRPNEGRDDVLVFSSAPLDNDVEVTGFITVVLYASTTAVDTDFTAMLVDVEPTGYARFLTDGILRARYRESTKEATPIVPGEIYRYEIDLWATSNVFKAGHRIRVYVSSSNFPRFNRNPNTGAPISGSQGMVKATQTIYHDAAHPSALVVPLVPK